MSGQPRGIPVLRKVRVKPSASSVATAPSSSAQSSQGSIYRKTTTTVVQKSSGYGQPSRAASGARPRSADVRSFRSQPPRSVPDDDSSGARSVEPPSGNIRSMPYSSQSNMRSKQYPSSGNMRNTQPQPPGNARSIQPRSAGMRGPPANALSMQQGGMRGPPPNEISMQLGGMRGPSPYDTSMQQGGMPPRAVPGVCPGTRTLQAPKPIPALPGGRTSAYGSRSGSSSSVTAATGAIPKIPSNIKRRVTTTSVSPRGGPKSSSTRIEETTTFADDSVSDVYSKRNQRSPEGRYGQRGARGFSPRENTGERRRFQKPINPYEAGPCRSREQTSSSSYQESSEDWDLPKQPLEDEVESTLLDTASYRPKTALKATGARRTRTSTPMIHTGQGSIPAKSQVTLTKTITKIPGLPDVVGRDIVGIEDVGCGMAEKTELAVKRTSPSKHAKAHSPKTREVVTVTSSISNAPGIRQTTKSVSYEGDPSDIQKKSSPSKPTPTQVARMVAEETALINETLALHMPEVKLMSPSNYPVRKKSGEYAIDKDALTRLSMGSVIITEADEPSPEMVANMMNTEERGLTMESSPANLYNYLFSDDHSEPVVQITSVAPTPLQDVVVPLSKNIPDQAKELEMDPDILNVSIAAEKNADDLKESTYCSIVGAEPLQAKNTARKGKKSKRTRVTLIEQEVPPWGIQDVASIVDVVGGPLAGDKAIPEQSQQEIDPAVEGIEYILQMEAPQHYSQVQLRGAQNPSWFPGYYMALPDSPNLVSLAKSPSQVFTAAWRATQPDIFDDQSLFVV